MEDNLHCYSQCYGQIHDKTINAVNLGIIVLDSKKSVVLWNHWMEERSGLSKQDALGKPLDAIFPDLDNPRFFTAISQAIETGNSSILAQSIHKSPLPLFKIDESEKLAQAIDIQPLKTIEPSRFNCLIQITDVGSAVKREDQLKSHAKKLSNLVRELSESDTRANAIIDISGDGVIATDKKGKIQSFNTRAEEIFGCKEEDVLDQNVSRFFSDAYAKQVPAFTRMLTQKGDSLKSGTWRFMEAKKKDGTVFPINLNLTTVLNAGKLQIIGIVRDLSELEASERALQESNNSLEMALDSGELWVWDWEIKSGGVYHDRMIKMLGYEKDQFTRHILNWRSLIHPDDWPQVNMRMRQHLDGESTLYECEYRLLMASGDWMWVHDQGRVVARDDKGNALRVVGINQNITRRKIAEIEAIDASNRALEAARVKSEFLGNMSHELRTPMNGIMGVLNLLKQSEANQEQLEYIDVAKRSAESLLKMIDNILDFSKLGAKSVQLELLSFDPEDIMKDVIKLLAKSAKEKGIILNYIIENHNISSITTDPGRLRQVLLNLAGNAIKFTHQGYVLIRLHKTETGYLLFEVEDTGIGIPENRQHLIFDAFAQADVSTTRKYGGTGLGLGISKQLVELMGGKIRVESKQNEGSRFSFTIKNHETLPVNQDDYAKECV